MSQNGTMGRRKQSGYDGTKGLKVTMGWNVTIFMGKKDVKYVGLKCNHGKKCHSMGIGAS
jgi:hypothetical protein